jgi:hypothetical protein
MAPPGDLRADLSDALAARSHRSSGQADRRRRLADAALLMPFAGIVAVGVTMLWTPADGQRRDLLPDLFYLFGFWAVFVLAIGLLARRLGSTHSQPPPPEG